MPFAPLHACAVPGCPTLVRGGGMCHVHRAKSGREAERARGSAHARGYTKDWARARARYLAGHPLCAECERQGRTTPARVVDHVVPHRGDERLFWDEGNWQALCDYTTPYNCHGAKTAREANEMKETR